MNEISEYFLSRKTLKTFQKFRATLRHRRSPILMGRKIIFDVWNLAKINCRTRTQMKISSISLFFDSNFLRNYVSWERSTTHMIQSVVGDLCTSNLILRLEPYFEIDWLKWTLHRRKRRRVIVTCRIFTWWCLLKNEYILQKFLCI